MNNGLVGKWFLTTVYNRQLDQYIPQGGIITEGLSQGMYRVEILDLITGEFESCKICSVSAMVGWRLFDSKQEWLRVADAKLSEWQRGF